MKKIKNTTSTLTEKDIKQWIESDESTSDADSMNNTTKHDRDEILTQKFTEFQVRIVRTSMDFPLSVVKEMFSKSEFIDLDPRYQRRFRWTPKKKSQLIESFLLNIPVPSIYLFEKQYSSYEVMDGRQRLSALLEFFNDDLRLIGLEYFQELNGKRFGKLPITIQRGLLRRSINAIVLLSETTALDSSYFDMRQALFKRLNTGGIALNPQEIRNAYYSGPFRDTIFELSRLKNFRLAWSIPFGNTEKDEKLRMKNIVYNSMQDCELVLRFFAIRNVALCGLRGSLRKMLDKTLDMMNNASKEIIDNSANDFINALNRLTSGLGDDVFLININGAKKLSRPLYDALMVACDFCREIDISASKFKIIQRLESCLADEKTYEILVGRGNTVESILERIDLAIYIISGE